MTRDRVPVVVISRMVVYLRVLRDAVTAGKEYISSAELGDMAGVNSAQVRKDLAMFGEFGKQGVGYPVETLAEEIARILGHDTDMPIAVFGVGELGTALSRYLISRSKTLEGFSFTVKALFDSDPAKIGTELGGVVISPVCSLPEVCARENIRIGIIAVPAAAAQEVVDLAVVYGIKGFLNFAPAKLKVPPGVRVVSSDVTMVLQELAFYL